MYTLLYRNIKVGLSEKTAEEHDKCAIEVAKKVYLSKLKSKFGNGIFSIYKKSLDARNKDSIKFIYTVSVLCTKNVTQDDLYYVKKCGFDALENKKPVFLSVEKKKHPVVCGFGPSGMFCAYVLAKSGLCPVVLERGSDVDARFLKVNKYFTEGVLDENCNVQFGEGGAGTFSDGKLLTRISDPLSNFVLEKLCEFGAPKEILYLAKPHIGTDILRSVVKNMRKEIESLGGKILFCSTLTSFDFSLNGRIKSVQINGKDNIECDSLFLCIGHSARDTFSLLLEKGVDMSPKDFSVGVRVEHLQEDIDKALYGKHFKNPALEKGQYTLSAKNNDRGVYSFCMCPGGVVVASASERDEIVTNGMSYYKRDGLNANSAIAVSVKTSDYGGNVLAAIDFQKQIEKKAYNLDGKDGHAPIMLLGDFITEAKKLSEPQRIMPTYTGKTKICDISEVFPKFINDMLKFGFNEFEKHIEGFSAHDAVLTAPETRTSSPVRIERCDDFSSVKYKNIYPVGEGAGYAGGITSAAVDGLRCALEYVKKVSEE